MILRTSLVARVLAASLAALSTGRAVYAENPPQLAWLRQFDGRFSSGISGDGQQIYATVSARNEDCLLQVFDFAGNPRWSYKDFKPAVDGYSNSFAAGCWADGSGHVYWPVNHTDSVNGGDALLYNFDAAGAIAWQRTFPQYAGIGQISGDGDGHLYTTGGATPGALISKFDADGQEAWHRIVLEEDGRYRGADDVVALPAGGAAVAGSFSPGPTVRLDAFVSKFDENGNVAWTREFGTAFSDSAEGVTADALGNIYVTGSQDTFSDYAAFLRKYSPDGDLLWNRQFGGSGSSTFGEAVAADAAGNVYVTGGTRASLAGPNAGDSDVYVRKYDPAGNIAWTFQLGTSSDEECRAIWLDPQGNIVIAGRTFGQFAGPGTGSGNAFVALLAPSIIPGDFDFNGVVDGNDFLALQRGLGTAFTAADLQTWKTHFGARATVALGTAAPEPSGSLLAATSLAAALALFRRPSLRRPVVAALAAAGLLAGAEAGRAQTVEWIRQLGTSDNEIVPRVSADGLGNVYVSGWTNGSLGGPNAGDSDVFVARYGATGRLLWTRQFGTTGNDFSSGVSADRLGNVYISGTTYGSLGGPNAGFSDAFVSKYDDAGVLQWTRQLGTMGEDLGIAVSADGLGNVCISGSTQGSLGGPSAGGSSDAFIAKYDAAGALQWTRQLGTANTDSGGSISADGLGNVYISGFTFGSLGGPNAGGQDAFIAKYDADGARLWTRQLGTTGHESSSVSADGLGNVYISGSTQGSLGGPNAGDQDAFIAKYDDAGALQWIHQLGTSSYEFANSVSADGLGNVYISGHTQGSLGGPNAGSSDAFVAKYAAAGVLQWIRQLGTSSHEFGDGVSADGLGNVYIAGTTGGSLGGPNAGANDVFLVKLFDADAVPNLPGDFNHDGAVDGADFLAWQQGRSPAPLSAADLAAWKANFGPPGTVAGAATVPEPNGFFLAATALAACHGPVASAKRRAASLARKNVTDE